MFKQCFLFLALIILSSKVFSLELSTEVSIPSDVNNQKISTDRFKEIGKLKIIKEFLKSKDLDGELYFQKIDAKKMSPESFDNYLKPFFKSVSFIRLAGGEDNDSHPGQKGTVVVDLNTDALLENYSDVIYNIELVSHQNMYLDLNVELLGDTKWEDLGVMGISSFSPVIINSWRDHFLKNIEGFESIEEKTDDYKKILDFNPKKIHPKSLEVLMTVTYKKLFENKNTNKITFEIDGHILLLNASTREVNYSYNFNQVKKEFTSTNRKDLSSALATLTFNLIKSQTAKVVESIKLKTNASENLYNLKGQTLFSEITSAKSTLEKYLNDQAFSVSLKSMGLASSTIAIKSDATKVTLLLKKLKEMGKLPLSSSVNEQKFLVFDAENNSFAIVSNN